MVEVEVEGTVAGVQFIPWRSLSFTFSHVAGCRVSVLSRPFLSSGDSSSLCHDDWLPASAFAQISSVISSKNGASTIPPAHVAELTGGKIPLTGGGRGGSRGGGRAAGQLLEIIVG